jgi:hypothetical protein
MVHIHSSQGFEDLQEVGQVGDQTAGQLDEEGASQDERSVCSNNHRNSSAILDNVLTVGESAEREEGAGCPHPHPGGLQEGSGRGV